MAGNVFSAIFPSGAGGTGGDLFRNIVGLVWVVPGEDEIVGSRYQSWANADTYVQSQTPTTNSRWAILLGNNAENIVVKNYDGSVESVMSFIKAEGIKREVREATQLEIELVAPLHPFDTIVRSNDKVSLHVIYIDYLARVTGGKLKLGSDVGEVG